MITQANYSRNTMRALMDVLPHGTGRQVADTLNLPYTKVANVIYGKLYNEAIIREIERRHNQVKQSLQES